MIFLQAFSSIYSRRRHNILHQIRLPTSIALFTTMASSRLTNLLVFSACYCIVLAFSLCNLVVGAAIDESIAPLKASSKAFAMPMFDYEGVCEYPTEVSRRATRLSIEDFGGVGDGKTLNTQAFHKAIDHVQTFASEGGAELYIPPGKWLTGSFNLTSHMTLFLEENALILGSQDIKQWPVIQPLPSYGRGRELPGGRHISLLHGENLTDVIITGNNGCVDGQGAIWWDMFKRKKLDFTRGSLVEFINSDKIVITNLTFQNSPFWTIHPVYCNKVFIQGLTILNPVESPNTDGIDPDSSSNVCIQDCSINIGDDLVVIKSGWDEYGITYGRPSCNITVRRIVGSTRASSGIAIGSEMSGGVYNVHVSDLKVGHTGIGVRIKSSPGRGGYVRDIYVTDVEVGTASTGIQLTMLYGEHPDNKYNPKAFPNVGKIYIQNFVAHNVSHAAKIEGIPEVVFQEIHLSNISMHSPSNRKPPAWDCSYVQGTSELVDPPPCPQLQN